MKVLPMVGGALVWALLSSPAVSQAAKQPPMNDFNSAFYTCESGGAFAVAYDSATPTQVTLTTSNNNKQYTLPRSASEDQLQFGKGAVKFRLVGQTAVVDGTKLALKNCKLKSH